MEVRRAPFLEFEAPDTRRCREAPYFVWLPFTLDGVSILETPPEEVKVTLPRLRRTFVVLRVGEGDKENRPSEALEKALC